MKFASGEAAPGDGWGWDGQRLLSDTGEVATLNAPDAVLTEPGEWVESRLAPLRRQLAVHPLYARLRTVADLRIFLQSHVFAVWDFMSLLKALQRGLTCIEVPWTPSARAASRRFVNEIVFGEESDLYEGRAVSHFELYVEAMQECGADTGPIDALLQALRSGESVDEGLVAAPAAARTFVEATFEQIRGGRLHAIAASFTYGREDLIPDVFRALVRELNGQRDGELQKFVWYLERHIEVDSEDHGPLAFGLIRELCGEDQGLWLEAIAAAEDALRARLALWDGIAAQLALQ